MIDSIIMISVGIWATLLGFRVLGRGPRWEAWHRRLGRVFTIIGPLLMAIGTVLAVVAHQRAIPNAAIQVHGQTLTSGPTGLVVELGPEWQLQAPQAGADVIAVHTPTGAVLVGSVAANNPADEAIATTLDKVLEGRRKKWGTVRDVSRGITKIGSLTAGWIKFAIPKGADWIQCVIVLAQKGPYAINFSCSGADPAQAACRTLLLAATVPE